MKFCQKIKKEKVLNIAINLIIKSKKTINMTMDMQEEINNPLPQKYHKKLVKLIKNGVEINRYVFGPKKLLKKIKKSYPEIKTHFGGSLEKYQRMLIVDGKQGLFAVNGIVFFSRFKPLINSLLEYVKIYK